MSVNDIHRVLGEAGVPETSASRIAELMIAAGGDWMHAHREIPAKWVSAELHLSGVCGECDGIAEQVVGRCLAISHWEPSVADSRPASGPGTELKKLLAKFGIVATPDCSCNERAAEMDRNGVEWCEANVDVIVGWLREEAANRGLPFVDAIGRMLVRRAIRNARKR